MTGRTDITYLQGIAHVVDMVGHAKGDERRDICQTMLDNLGKSQAPQAHKDGVQYACNLLLVG